MKLKEFIESTLNKWVKIENDGVTIIQKIESYKQTNKPTVYDCTGYSISNAEGEVLELSNFYMTKSHLDGKVTETFDVDEDIKILKQEA